MAAVEERVLYKNPAAVPAYAMLSTSYREWVGALLEIQAGEDELERLKAALKDIRGMHRTRAEAAASLKASWEGYRQRYVGRVAKFLAESIKSRDPLSRGDRLDFIVKASIPLKDFQEAFNLLPDELFSEVPDAEKQREIEKIEKHRAEIEGRLAELRCPPYLALDRMGVLGDVREFFLREWRSKQAEACEACDVLGMNLKFCSDDVKWAYRELNLSAFIRKNGAAAAIP